MAPWCVSDRAALAKATASAVCAVIATAACVLSRRKQRRLLRALAGTGCNSEPISAQKLRNEAWIKAEVRVASCEAAYRRLVRRHVGPGDSVIELGCHCGTTTVLARSLCQGSVIGVDTSEFNIEKAKSENGGADIRWILGDASDPGNVVRPLRTELRNPSAPLQATVILVDVSGSRNPGLLIEMIQKYDKVVGPRVFIVKSYKLFSFVSSVSLTGGGARDDGC